MPRLSLAFALATLCAFVFAVPVRAEEPRYPVTVLDRLGRLPFELVQAKKTDAEGADAMFLAAFLRLPTEDEKERVVKHLSSGKDRTEVIQNIAWAFINTKEFMKLHGIDKDQKATLAFFNKDVNELWGKIAGEMKKPEK